MSSLDLFDDQRSHPPKGVLRSSRLPKVTLQGGGYVSKGDDGRIAVAGRECVPRCPLSRLVLTPFSTEDNTCLRFTDWAKTHLVDEKSVGWEWTQIWLCQYRCCLGIRRSVCLFLFLFYVHLFQCSTTRFSLVHAMANSSCGILQRMAAPSMVSFLEMI